MPQETPIASQLQEWPPPSLKHQGVAKDCVKSLIVAMAALHQRFFAFIAPLAFASALAGERPAQAVLTYYIYQSGPDVIIQTSGSLILPGPFAQNTCANNGSIISQRAIICTGPDAWMNAYTIVSGPTSFGSGNEITADSSNGPQTTSLAGFANDPYPGASSFYIDSSYVSGNPIISGASFNAKTLSALGITSTGLLGTWVLAGTGDTIQVITGAPPVPVPLPIAGSVAALGFSRRLRRRVNLGRSASQSASSIST
jgi:hypothetical protein